MKKKILYVAHLESHIFNFHIPFLKMLKENDYEVHVATNGTKKIPYCDQIFHLPFTRNPFTINNFKAYLKLRNLCKENKYDLMHCHTPSGGAIGRLAGKNICNKIFYTAHGFHFYKGAPKLNWILYYPIEKWLSRYTDVLITMNQEDFYLAKTKFHSKQVKNVPGVGIDLNKFEIENFDRNKYRDKLYLKKENIMLLSVGELSGRKNHEVVVKSLSVLKNKNIHYYIAGTGEKKQYLLNLAHELDVSEQVHLLGYRTDIVELNKVADIFIFPSLQEGLPVALLEAMACGLATIVSDIRGNNDLILDKTNGLLFNPNDPYRLAENIKKLSENKEIQNFMKENNKEKVKDYSSLVVNKIMYDIYNFSLEN